MTPLTPWGPPPLVWAVGSHRLSQQPAPPHTAWAPRPDPAAGGGRGSPMYGLVPASAVALSPSFMMVAMLKSVRCACPARREDTARVQGPEARAAGGAHPLPASRGLGSPCSSSRMLSGLTSLLRKQEAGTWSGSPGHPSWSPAGRESPEGPSPLKAEAPETRVGLEKVPPGNILTEPGEGSYSAPGVTAASRPPPAEARRENVLDTRCPSPLAGTCRLAPPPEPWGCAGLTIWVPAVGHLALGLTWPHPEVLSACSVPEPRPRNTNTQSPPI